MSLVEKGTLEFSDELSNLLIDAKQSLINSYQKVLDGEGDGTINTQDGKVTEVDREQLKDRIKAEEKGIKALRTGSNEEKRAAFEKSLNRIPDLTKLKEFVAGRRAENQALYRNFMIVLLNLLNLASRGPGKYVECSRALVFFF